MSIFKGYDIRGIYKEAIDEKVASDMGKAFAAFLSKRIPGMKATSKGSSKSPSSNNIIFIARDNRSSSLSLRNAFADSLLSSGFDVIDIGIASTPVLQFAISASKAAGACMITASHNPPQYNGFKMYLKNLPLMSAQMQEMEKIYNSKKFIHSAARGHELNKSVDGEYISDILNRIHLKRKLRVVIDSGNGTCGPIAHELLKRMGCEVVSLFEDMESAFLNHIADPHNPANLKWLQDAVIGQQAHLGIAFDGDGDRAGFVDEKGKIIREDDICILFLKHELQKRKGAIVYDLRLSNAVPEEVKKLKGKAIISKAGRIAIRDNLISNKALFGGEVSGHYFFEDHFGFDDGIYAGAKMLEIVSSLPENLSAAVSRIPHYPSTPEIRLHCDNEKKHALVEKITALLKKKYGKKVLTIDGVYLKLENSWGLVRVSNTEPAITLRFEGNNKKELKSVYTIFSDLLKNEGIRLPTLR